jgi:hypothetical protein
MILAGANLVRRPTHSVFLRNLWPVLHPMAR